MANEEHLKILREGADRWNAWRRAKPEAVPDLRRADLRESLLANYDLSRADCNSVNLNRANIYFSDLDGASLHRANLIGATISKTSMAGTVLTKARCGGTVLADLDLSRAIGLNKVTHRRPSTIGLDTVMRSGRTLPREFMRGIGLSDEAMEAVTKASAPRHYYSAFISYSHSDQRFARALYDVLQDRGVRCWLDVAKLKVGARILDTVNDAIRSHDKVLLCCSSTSLGSSWVDDEITIAVERERSERRLVLIPLNLDGALFRWQGAPAARLRDRLAADFTGWEEDGSRFAAEVEKLAEALQHDNRIA